MTPPQRAGQAAHPASRVLVLLVCGHVAVAVAAVVVAIALLADMLGRLGESGGGLPPGWLPGMLGVALASLVLAQVLSVRRVLGHRRALVGAQPGPGPHDAAEAALVTAMYRTGWPAALAHHPILIGMLPIGLVPPPAPLLALFCVLPATSLLLDHAHARWTYRCLQGRGPRTRLLPPGDGDRIRRGLHHTPALLIGSAAAAALLALLSAPWPPGHEDPPTALLTGLLPALLPALAAASAALLALLLVRPVRRIRAAIDNDRVHLPALDAAATTMCQLGAAGTAATALVGTAVLTNPTTVLLAAAPTLLLVPALSWVTLHLASATSIAIGAPFPTGNRRRAASSAGSSQHP